MNYNIIIERNHDLSKFNLMFKNLDLCYEYTVCKRNGISYITIKGMSLKERKLFEEKAEKTNLWFYDNVNYGNHLDNFVVFYDIYNCFGDLETFKLYTKDEINEPVEDYDNIGRWGYVPYIYTTKRILDNYVSLNKELEKLEVCLKPNSHYSKYLQNLAKKRQIEVKKELKSLQEIREIL